MKRKREKILNKKMNKEKQEKKKSMTKRENNKQNQKDKKIICLRMNLTINTLIPPLFLSLL